MSGANLAYHLRVNKHIDRCLFMEALGVVHGFQNLREYGYVSMGGSFLEDFRVIHQTFGTTRMYSFDGSQSVISRQQINKPFGFIQCAHRMSSDVVANFDSLRGQQFGDERNVIVWLDYTTPSERQAQLTELEVLLTKLISGDVFRVTLNANRATLGSNEEYRRLVETDRTKHRTLWDFRYERLATQLGEQLPDDRKDPEYLKGNEAFYTTIARCIKKAALNGVSARQELLRIQPLLSNAYSDGQDMVTLTGLVLGQAESERFLTHPAWVAWEHKPGENWDDFVIVNVPHLSQRERHVIHGTMQANGEIAPEIGFSLAESQLTNDDLLDQYRRHYLRYPTFAPLDTV